MTAISFRRQLKLVENNRQYEPYTYYFTVGLLSAFFGVALWLLFSLRLLNFYPRQAHANLMFFGFLWSFVAGFLMTAIPKMTGAIKALKWEIFLGLVFLFAQWIFNFENFVKASAWLYLGQLLFLLIFVVRRFVEKKKMPFEGFVFMPFAFMMGLVGLLLYIYDNSRTNVMYTLAGQAFVLNLICGVGSRLIPVLSRLPSALSPDIPSDSFQRGKRLIHFLTLAVLLNVSFIIEVMGWEIAGYSIRTFVFGWISVRLFRFFHKPLTRTFVGWGLKAGIAGIFLSYFALATGSVKDSLGHLHVMFIAGLGLITLMVATRVTVAHGGGSLDLELRSKTIFAVIICFLLSALLRTFVGMQLDTIFILSASVAFLLALVLWSSKLAKLMWKI
jgi:uncharacterized protein involved in response to NO